MAAPAGKIAGRKYHCVPSRSPATDRRAWLNRFRFPKCVICRRTMENCECSPLRLLSFLINEVNDYLAEAFVGTRNLEDLAVTFLSESFLRKRSLHL